MAAFARNYRVGSVLLGSLVFGLTISMILTKRHYFADGASYMFHILANDGFAFVDPWRNMAIRLTQWLPTLGISLGLRDVDAISVLWGVGLYMHYFVSFLICYRITRGHAPHLLLFPLLSMVVATFNASMDMVSEAHVMASLFWPLFLYAHVNRSYSVADYAVIVVLAILTIRSYASAMVLIPLIAIGVVRFKLLEQTLPRPHRAFWWCVLAVLGMSFIAGICAFLEPASEANRGKAMSAVLTMRGYVPFLFSAAVAIAALIALLIDRLPARLVYVSYVVAASAGLFLVIVAVAEPGYINPYADFSARVLLVYVPFALGIIASAQMLFRIPVSSRGVQRAGLLVMIGISFQLFWQSNVTYQWARFVELYRQELASHAGIVPFEKTRLGLEEVDGQLVRALGWSWTDPYMSVVLAERGVVKTLIGPRSGRTYRDGFPWCPPDLSRYGIVYAYGRGECPLTEAAP